MQTFLPYPNFSLSASCLDNKRLGKQRSEALTLLRGYWPNHPAAKMWWDYHYALAKYGVAVCTEWRNRGYKDSCIEEFMVYLSINKKGVMPHWLGNTAFHLSHQSNLVRKNPEYYRKFFPDVPDNLPYVWPS